mmetsp:Transcript_30134/g.56370  ORF Transcript_30134/g.56370 Transcript_30134/m.56370 type:complete len:224 (+) Transcript_30134:439-1110(+)
MPWSGISRALILSLLHIFDAGEELLGQVSEVRRPWRCPRRRRHAQAPRRQAEASRRHGEDVWVAFSSLSEGLPSVQLWHDQLLMHFILVIVIVLGLGLVNLHAVLFPWWWSEFQSKGPSLQGIHKISFRHGIGSISIDALDQISSSNAHLFSPTSFRNLVNCRSCRRHMRRHSQSFHIVAGLHGEHLTICQQCCKMADGLRSFIFQQHQDLNSRGLLICRIGD